MSFIQEQINYVQSELKRGVSQEDLKTTLMQHGYSEEQVTGLLSTVQTNTPVPSALDTPQATITEPVADLDGFKKRIKKIVLGIILFCVVAGAVWFGLYFVVNKIAENTVDNFMGQSEQFTKAVEKMIYMRKLMQDGDAYDQTNGGYTDFCVTNTDSSVACVDGTESIRVSSFFPEGGIFCFDSNGYVGEVNELPDEAVCVSSTPGDVAATSSGVSNELTKPEVAKLSEVVPKKKKAVILSVGKVPDTGVYKMNAREKGFKDIPFKLNTFISKNDIGTYAICLTFNGDGVRVSKTDCTQMIENIAIDTVMSLDALSLTPFPVNNPYYSVGKYNIEIIIALIPFDVELVSQVSADTSDNLTLLRKNALAIESTGVFTAEATSVDPLALAKSKGRDGATVVLLHGGRSSAEIYHDDDYSYKNYCQSSAVQELSITIASAECVDSKSEYRLSSVLSDGTYYCVDSTGMSNSYSSKPSGFSCE